MQYLKLIWLIMSGRLRIEHRNRPRKLALDPRARGWATVPVNRLTRP
jgi:hypothetical protein